MAAAYIYMLRRRQFRRERVFRDRNNPLDYMDDQDIIQRYRLSRPVIIELCNVLNHDLERPTMRSQSLPVSIKILTALRFFASGSFYAVNADIHGISKSSVSRIVSEFTDATTRISSNYIKMPRTDNEINKIMQGFYAISHFPNVLGAVDGTHIRIIAPKNDEHLFVNRKNFHSINIKSVCDSTLKFTNVVAKWPGSTHDSFIWANSSLCQHFENGQIHRGWLLGDSGYPLRPFLMTPVLNPTTRKEENYNAAHIRTRNTIERCFGLWKMRFRCVDSSGGTLLFSPQKCCKIAVSTMVLHNMCIDNNVPLPRDDRRYVNGHQIDNFGNVYGGRMNDGFTVRTRLIQNKFQ